MEGEGPAKYYPPKEERLNIISHAVGLGFSVVALFFLWERAEKFDNSKLSLSYAAFSLGLLLLYAASTLYHSARDPVWRFRLKVLDHIAIFILIAGTYTPFALITLEGFTGWLIFWTAWSIALLGTVLKLFFTGRYTVLSTGLYLGMGWIIIFAVKPLIENLPEGGLWWLFSGGVFYTLGAILYSIRKIPYNHAIFHLFVLLGSFSHFMAIYGYVFP